jgi:threonine synthase
VVFSVPSGNLGNITAGVIAQRLGLPVARFIAACNVNDVLPEYLRTGTYRARPSIATCSNAMDVGDPSNFPRLAQLVGGDVDALRARVTGISIDDRVTRDTIRDTWGRSGYLLDPHGAVGVAAAKRYVESGGGDAPVIALATAHPAKFGEVIREELGFEPALPEAWRDWTSRRVQADDLGGTDYATFRDCLRQ